MNSVGPPPPPPASTATGPKPPVLAAKGPAGAFLVELVVYTGTPFKDHWAYWVGTHANPNIGVLIHAAGSVMTGFTFEIKRSHNFDITQNHPNKRIPLMWVGREYFDEAAMFNGGVRKVEATPVCPFETSVHKVPAPAKSLNEGVADAQVKPGRRAIKQKNCQTWVVEAADVLLQDGIFTQEVVDFLRAIQQ